jgi:hypothetical protein
MVVQDAAEHLAAVDRPLDRTGRERDRPALVQPLMRPPLVDELGEQRGEREEEQLPSIT